MTDRRVTLKPIYRTIWSEDYGRVVEVRRRGKPAWVPGTTCLIKGRLGIWRNLLRMKKRRYRAEERLGSQKRVAALVARRIKADRRQAAERRARRVRGAQHAQARRVRRHRQRKNRLATRA